MRAVPRPVRDFRMPERLCGQPDGGRSTSGERAAEHCRCQGVLCTDQYKGVIYIGARAIDESMYRSSFILLEDVKALGKKRTDCKRK